MNYKYIPLEKKESSNVISLVLLSKLEMSMHLEMRGPTLFINQISNSMYRAQYQKYTRH